jgi:hypothetical protein
MACGELDQCKSVGTYESKVTVLSKSPGDIIDFLARRLEPLAKIEAHLLQLEEKILSQDVSNLTIEQALTRYEDLSRIVLRHVELLSKVMQKEDVETYMKGLGIIDIYMRLKALPVSSLEKVQRFIDDSTNIQGV